MSRIVPALVRGERAHAVRVVTCHIPFFDFECALHWLPFSCCGDGTFPCPHPSETASPETALPLSAPTSRFPAPTPSSFFILPIDLPSAPAHQVALGGDYNGLENRCIP